jgi:hypothetical protein
MIRAIGMLCIAASMLAGTASAKPRIELDLVTEQGFPLTGQQQWAQFLGQIEFDNLRIRQASGSEKVEVKREGSDESPLYLVTGVLTRGNQLVLPGGRFSIRDKDALTEWKNRLLRGGAGGLEPKVRAAFGLSTEQFLAVHERLATPVGSPTKDKSPKEVVREIARGLAGGVTIDPEALKAFDEKWTVPEELQGLSAGTTLAAAIRPLGLVLVPHAVAEDDVRLVITDVRKAPESWPIGWPKEKNEKELAPKLYEFFTFEAPGNPLQEAIGALQPKLELPFLYDHNGMARQKIDLAKTTIKFPESRSYYKKVLDRILFEAKMKCELRVDEAGAPFLWISPVKK